MDDNVADPLTKPLARVKHETHAFSIGMQYLDTIGSRLGISFIISVARLSPVDSQHIKPILTWGSTQIPILEEETAEVVPHSRVTEIIDLMNQLPREQLRHVGVTTVEEIFIWKYADRDNEPPYDPVLTGMPTLDEIYKFALLTLPKRQVFSNVPISELNTIMPPFGFVFLDKDEIQRFFNPDETHKYTVETFAWIYKLIATEVKNGRINRDETKPLFELIEAQASHRSYIYNMYLLLKRDDINDFPNSHVE
ncbi:hypothetical protein OSB04_024908 [Centaurea solstitialis]|uniref:Uncharacterized protein n=1 Tax=Centaurea solstitialis TaxID=347529 RepID=A0AA38SYQ7_9ASTR|nr:hypothetical protein OSB04_024908 [Centaurea solstitialis]